MPLPDVQKCAIICAQMPDTDVIPKDWRDWPDDKRLSVRRVAWMLDVGRAHVRRLIRQKRLGAARVGHIYKVRIVDLRKYLDRQKEIGKLRKGK